MKQHRMIYRIMYNSCLFWILLFILKIQVQAEEINTVLIDKSQLRVGMPLQVILENENIQNLQYRWYVDDKIISDSKDSSYVPTEQDYEHWIKVQVLSDDEVIGNDMVYFSKLPVVYINTTDGALITSKEKYKDGNMYIQGNDDYASQYDGEIEIKGRGNSSWSFPQKPYKIKLDKSTDLFGFGKNKHWVLISPYLDQSSMRNKIAYDLSGELGLLQMQLTWVDVVLNGVYVGNYGLCEHIRVGDSRIPIFNWEDEIENVAKAIYKREDELTEDDRDVLEEELEKDLSWITSGEFTYNGTTYTISDYYQTNNDISGGYIFEMDELYDEESRFTTNDGLYVMLNTPEYLNTNEEMFGYVKDYWQQFENGICSVDGYNGEGKHYQELADFNSMVAYWLTMEIMGNNDAFYKSRYAYKDLGGLLTFGPAWDFDWGVGSITAGTRATGWKVSSGTLWNDFIDDPYFCIKAAEKYWSIRGYLEEIIRDDGMIDSYYSYLCESGRATDEKYPQTTYQGNARRGFESDVQALKTYLTTRIAWLDEQFASTSSVVTSLYKPNDSANPYTRSEEELSIFLHNTVEDTISDHLKADGVLEGKDNVDVEVTVKDENTTLLNVYVNGYKYAEDIPVVDGKVSVNIDVSKLTRGGVQNILSFIGKNADGEVTYTNFATVIVSETSQEDILSYDYPSENKGQNVDANATSGSYAASGILSASVDGVNEIGLVYSKPEYTDGNKTDMTVPIMAASETEPWGESAYFEIECPTKGYENIVFSASLGATKKGPRDYKLQYSLDHENWIDVPLSDVSLTKNKVMQQLFSQIPLPEECADNSVVYIRIVVASDIMVSGDEGLIGSTGGEAAINHIAVYGIKTELTYADYKSVLKKAEQLEPEDYTNFEILEEALGQDVYREGISQDEIDAIVKAIEDAIKQLQKKEADTGNTPSDDSDPESDDTGNPSGGSGTENSDGDKVSDDKTDDATDNSTDTNPAGNTGNPTGTGDEQTTTNTPVAKGTILTVTSEKCTVVVTSADAANPSVAYKETTDKKASKVTIPDSVTVDGVTYKVTSIADNAFAKNKKITKVIIGKNVISIGKNAFRNCGKLKTVIVQSTILNRIGANAFRGDKKLSKITLKTTRLTKKSIGKNALKGTNKKLVVKVPKRIVSKYKAYFKGKGNKTIRVKQ